MEGFITEERIKSEQSRSRVERIYNMRLTSEKYHQALERERRHWVPLENRLLKQSQQAVVPVGNGYPEEWQDSKDVYAPHVERFTNICDVVSRREQAVILNNKMVSPLIHDKYGPYRWIKQSGSLIVRDHRNSSYLLTLRYEGNIYDIKLKVGNHFIDAQAVPGTPLIKFETNVSLEDMKKLNLIVIHTVKLRSMSWVPATA